MSWRRQLGANTTLHERFGTAVVEWEAGRIDVAERRAESYPAPGALPEVRPGSRRRTCAAGTSRSTRSRSRWAARDSGELTGAEHALEDLAAGRLRVLHEQSFIDDPTRLLRLARYRARLGFELEPRTAALAGAGAGGRRAGDRLRRAHRRRAAPGA